MIPQNGKPLRAPEPRLPSASEHEVFPAPPTQPGWFERFALETALLAGRPTARSRGRNAQTSRAGLEARGTPRARSRLEAAVPALSAVCRSGVSCLRHGRVLLANSASAALPITRQQGKGS